MINAIDACSVIFISFDSTDTLSPGMVISVAGKLYRAMDYSDANRKCKWCYACAFQRGLTGCRIESEYNVMCDSGFFREENTA